MARGRVATVAVNSFVFKQPVHIGDVVSFFADIVRVGNTSVTVCVEVYAERRPSDPKVVKVTEATLTFVAIDPDGQPRADPQTMTDKKVTPGRPQPIGVVGYATSRKAPSGGAFVGALARGWFPPQACGRWLHPPLAQRIALLPPRFTRMPRPELSKRWRG